MSELGQVFDKLHRYFKDNKYECKPIKKGVRCYDFKKNGAKHFGMIQNKKKGVLFYFCSKELEARGYSKDSIQLKNFIERVTICFNDKNEKDFEYYKNNEVRARIYTFKKAKELINDFISNIERIA